MALVFRKQAPQKPHVHVGSYNITPPASLPAAAVQVLLSQPGMLPQALTDAWEKVLFGLQSAEPSKRDEVGKRIMQLGEEPPVYYTVAPTSLPSDQFTLDFYI